MEILTAFFPSCAWKALSSQGKDKGLNARHRVDIGSRFWKHENY